jgi:arylsulfatase A-like enzyme
MIDEQVGKIMDALEANGFDDTVIVFTSDHGEMLCDHGHIQKWTMYDEVTRVPTMVWSPGRFQSATVDDLVSLFDLGPTVLELAGASVEDSMEAESLVPALEGDDEWTGRDVVFAEHARTGILEETEFMTMVRTDDWKLVHFVDHDDGQLFDLNADPEETENLWKDPDAQEAKRDLLDTLLEWRIKSDVHTANWAENFR